MLGLYGALPESTWSDVAGDRATGQVASNRRLRLSSPSRKRMLRGRMVGIAHNPWKRTAHTGLLGLRAAVLVLLGVLVLAASAHAEAPTGSEQPPEAGASAPTGQAPAEGAGPESGGVASTPEQGQAPEGGSTGPAPEKAPEIVLPAPEKAPETVSIGPAPEKVQEIISVLPPAEKAPEIVKIDPLPEKMPEVTNTAPPTEKEAGSNGAGAEKRRGSPACTARPHAGRRGLHGTGNRL